MAQYVYGKNVVSSLLRDKREILTLYLQEGRRDSETVRLANEAGVKVRYVSRNELDKMVQGNHQGYVAAVKEYRTYSIEEIMWRLIPCRIRIIWEPY